MQFLPGGGLRAENVRLMNLVSFAYDVPQFQISGGPGWANTEPFSLRAKGPQGEGAPDLRQMNAAERRQVVEQVRERMRTLLAERFHLVIRRETKEMPVYALVVAKNGLKLKEAGGDGSQQQIQMNRGRIDGQYINMDLLARNLAGRVSRPVLDRTGLKGNYSFKLEFSEEVIGPRGEGAGPAPDLGGPSIFTALQEQLGLKLESTKGPVEMIVIERAEKPTEN